MADFWPFVPSDWGRMQVEGLSLQGGGRLPPLGATTLSSPSDAVQTVNEISAKVSETKLHVTSMTRENKGFK